MLKNNQLHALSNLRNITKIVQMMKEKIEI